MVLPSKVPVDIFSNISIVRGDTVAIQSSSEWDILCTCCCDSVKGVLRKNKREMETVNE